MTLSIKNQEVERLTEQLAILTGNTKTGAVGQAVREKLDRLKANGGVEHRPVAVFVETRPGRG
jgi:hypothetical protein